MPRDPATARALRNRRLAANAALVCAALLCCSLIAFPPSRFALYPACPIHEYLGILCPGCGATRALTALLRGHPIEALRLNALFVLLLPFALAAAIRAWLRAVRPGEFHWPRVPAPALYATLALAAAFTLVRNLPH